MGADKPLRVWFCLALLSLALAACAQGFPWVREAADVPSCAPDRALTWEDFSKRKSPDSRAAATAVRFRIVRASPARFQVEFVPRESWVMPELVSRWNPFVWGRSAHVLRHEQVHFAISCIATRQANAHLTPDADVQSRLLLLQARAIRRNAQYDAETRHGSNVRMQEEWERRIKAELIAGPLPPPIAP